MTVSSGSPRPQAPGPAHPPGTPQVIVGDYTLLSRIGEGGMGIVHLARRSNGDRVALKVLRPHIVGDDEARARLAREVSSLSRIKSRWVAEIVDADPWAPVPYVATRYVPGLSLHDHVQEEGPITGADLMWFATGLAEGVASVHSVGVLHRDVKPSNVLMEGRTPILIDFGLARVADDPKLTHTGWLLGTPGYLAPEILYGEDATAASDVHSWAATVAFAGLGRPPFGRGPSMAIMDRVRRGEHDLTGIEGDLHELLTAALDPDPARRPRLDAILGWLRPQTKRLHAVPTAPVPAAPAPVEDLFTLPLAIAARSEAEQLTDRFTPPVQQQQPVGPTRILREEREEPADIIPFEDWGTAPPEPRTGVGERARRAVLLASGALALGVGTAAYPWLALLGVLLVVWLMRSGSLATSAHADRRRLRGRRWYDGVRFLIGTPWDLVRSIPGTVMLALWSLGLAVAGALVCYALAAGQPVTLFVAGVVLAAALFSGPGGSRVRSPLSRVVHPLSRSGGPWLGAVAVVLVIAAVLWIVLLQNGASWTPGGGRPFS